MLSTLNKYKILGIFLFSISFKAIASSPLPSQTKNSSELLLALKKLNVLGRVLYIAAHPDDENTGVLAYLANEKLVRTAYLSLTRGGGGQNLMGSEKGEMLGIIRTQELLAARRIDGAEQYFTRAIDFGYSKSAEETLKIWDREQILADIVWVIRSFQPDLILTRFTPKLGGHGHHLASAGLAEAAFRDAADPKRFQDQLQYVQPWQVLRLVWNVFPSFLPQDKGELSSFLKFDIGKFNFLIGKSYSEIAAVSRSMHKCQGFGSSPDRGLKFEYFQHVLGEPAEKDLFQDIDLSWNRIPGGLEVAKTLVSAIDTFNNEDPAASIPLLLKAHQQINEIPTTSLPGLTAKKKELTSLIANCAGLWVEAIAEAPRAPPGSSLNITAKAINRSQFPMSIEHILLPNSKTISTDKSPLNQHQTFELKTSIRIPPDLRLSLPYWLEEKPSFGHYRVKNQRHIGLPEIFPLPSANFMIRLGDVNLRVPTPILYRWTDPVMGERYRHIEISPSLTVNLEEEILLFSKGEAKPIRLKIKNHQEHFQGKLQIQLSSDWSVDRKEILIDIQGVGQEIAKTLLVTPPSTPSRTNLTFKVESEGPNAARSHKKIEYFHIPIQNSFPIAKLKLVRLQIETGKEKIGYIMGSGDDIPVILRQLGYDVTLLQDQELANGDLTGYQTILTGIRAYNTRKILKQTTPRLLEYVNQGGTLIDQYNKNVDLLVTHLGPYPFTLSKERVTMEDAPVHLLVPDHPLLNAPNKISLDDFRGWIQERGTYFPNIWDLKYESLLSCHDPGETPKEGGMLTCRYGKGTYIYTGYSWFRQIPAGVPGAIKIFSNLIAAGKEPQNQKF